MNLRSIDLHIISAIRTLSEPVARLGIFIVYFWFGALKVLGLSPAEGIVQNLYYHTLPLMPFDTFYLLFGLFECLIGLLFLWRGKERLVFPLLLAHLVTTCMPLILLPEITWNGFLVPTLEGQYIIKNVVIVAAALGIIAHLHPLSRLPFQRHLFK
jgi:uncharacterized membrane protein YkgB